MTQRTIQVRNPRTGAIDHSFQTPTPEALATRLAALRTAQADWLAIGLDGRIRAMEELCDAVDRHYPAILAALSADTGRHEWSVNEIEGLKGITRMRCATAAAALAEATGQSSDPSLRFQQQYVPYQLVGIISPWNYPLILCMIDAICALLAGCAVAIKPSEVTPRFIAPFKAAIAEVPHLRDVLEVIAGDGEIGGLIVDLTDTVVFTGSVPTGRKVQERAASQFKPVFLELGGSDPAVILSSADPDMAAEIVVRGATENSGQLCCAIERVYVHDSLLPAFTDRVVARMQALQMNTADIEKGELGPVIFARQADILRAQIDQAVAGGATIATGGRIVEHGGGLWCEPTVLTGVTQDMAIMREETFGPIVPIMAFSDTDQAVQLANDTTFGLSATVIGDEEAAIAVGSRINAGGMWINDFDTMGGVGARAEKTAFGHSGLGGSRYGYGGFLRFLRKKAIVVRRPATAA
ncbi:aldehyde dehydrogenase family protein [Gemmobacter sp.]|uniref:aldehyde dehydrogenase family protein n=1 Tax=Gemmobacter sp. TaxID=1898957 RepID=UPI002AFDF8C5|nr:aldehyde dehydrogenase family protein [Gemmobacter sp.]